MLAIVSVHIWRLEMQHKSRPSLPRPLKFLATVYLAPFAILGVLMALMFGLGLLVFLMGIVEKLLGG
jgi:hypothetical protein